jgi:hypothetical protein
VRRHDQLRVRDDRGPLMECGVLGVDFMGVTNVVTARGIPA